MIGALPIAIGRRRRGRWWEDEITGFLPSGRAARKPWERRR
jgi:hypothetical protein